MIKFSGINPKFLFILILLPLVLGIPTPAAAQPIGDGCGKTISNGFVVQCKPWQKGKTYTYRGGTFTVCASDPSCIQQPLDHWYFDDPVLRTRQANDHEVTLPAGLAWSHAPGWEDFDQLILVSQSGVSIRRPEKSRLFGISSYIVEIENKNGELNEGSSKGGIFRYHTVKNYFNPTDEDLNIPCFFNSDTEIRWRVRPCAGTDGSDCESEERAEWWTFRTSPAPEPLTPKDPDWNGQQSASGVDFCKSILTWCPAKVSKPKQPYNKAQERALSYQILVNSNENQATNLANAQIPEKFSAFANFLKKDLIGNAPQEVCHYLQKRNDGICQAETVNPTASGLTPRLYFSSYLNKNNDRDLFTKNILYYWQMRSCFNNSNANDESCSQTKFKYYGQKWKFTTATAPLKPPTPVAPMPDTESENSQNATTIGLPVTIAWKPSCGNNSYGYQIQEYNESSYNDIIGNKQVTTRTQIIFSKSAAKETKIDIEPIDLKLDTAYRWRIKGCWPSLPLKSNDCDDWSDWFKFRTTGKPPADASMEPTNNSNQIAMPITLKWENILGAKSYVLEINDTKIPITPKIDSGKATYQTNYPQITQNKNYRWKIRTCADEKSLVCGKPSSEFNFSTAALEAPKTSGQQSPADKETINANDLPLSLSFMWNAVPGTIYYNFVLNYVEKSAKEANKECATGEKANIFIDRQNTTAVDKNINGVYCLGKYAWTVQACMDSACQDAGPISEIWEFTLDAEARSDKSAGFMVCGQGIDNPKTSYDEREECKIKHLFLVLQKIINFVLFKLAFMILPILGLITGLIFYTSWRGTETMVNIISWWRAIGIGYLLIFFAWILVGMLLQVFGYNILWWKI